jgi:pimeloyl-ACP methyl ester carboxylesterase
MPIATTADGLQINYIDEGAGEEPLLLVFGLGSVSALAPDAWLSILRERFRLLRLDNRGTGRSSNPTSPFRVEDMAADALAVLDAAGIDRAHLYGHSMGGMIVQAMARDHPDRVRRLVLEATAPSAGAALDATNTSPDPASVEWRQTFSFDTIDDARADEAAITPASARAYFGIFLSSAFRDSALGEQTLTELTGIYAGNRSPSWRTLRWQSEAVMAFDNWDGLTRTVAPTLVVHPEHDIPPLPQAQAMADALVDGRLVVVPGVGHDVRWELPVGGAELIVDFLCPDATP